VKKKSPLVPQMTCNRWRGGSSDGDSVWHERAQVSLLVVNRQYVPWTGHYSRDFSEETAATIDDEVRQLVDVASACKEGVGE